MICVRLKGGLGNQMFQYAAGFALACRNGDKLALDTTAYEQGPSRGETLRELGILDFDVSAPTLSLFDARRHRNPHGVLSKAFRLVEEKALRRYYVDWHPEVMRRRGNVYLDGYFQSEKYFSAIARDIRTEFSLKPTLAKEIEDLRQEIERYPGTTVSLHVRRGDYVDNSRNAAVLDICTPDYYSRAVDQMRRTHPSLRVVVFSDDVEWAVSHIAEARDALIVNGGSSGQSFRPSQEMVLMSACRHHIIANSTFSWWGAYLNPRPEKVVVAPSRWTKGAMFSHRSILPSEWLRLPV